jgi:hypothetical protein
MRKQAEKFDLGHWRATISGKKRPGKALAARMLGVDQGAYSRWEQAGECPRVVRLAALALALGIK